LPIALKVFPVAVTLLQFWNTRPKLRFEKMQLVNETVATLFISRKLPVPLVLPKSRSVMVILDPPSILRVVLNSLNWLPSCISPEVALMVLFVRCPANIPEVVVPPKVLPETLRVPVLLSM
jgi:hypothetical protein